jgi:hypothetical protein
MKNAPLPKEVATVILEAIKNAIKSSESLVRYIVGEDAKNLAQAKKICLIHNCMSLFQINC